MTLEPLIVFAGVCHLGLLVAGALAAKVLDWRHELMKLCQLSRHMIWTHGGFIVLTIIAFAAISIFCAAELAAGGRVARAFCAFVACFWGSRVVVQFFLFDARPHLTHPALTVGYHTLTVVFIYLTIVYTLAALGVG